MKLNKNKILGGLVGITLLSTAFFEFDKGVKYSNLAEKYKIIDRQTYEFYDINEFVYKNLSYVSFLVGSGILLASLYSDSYKNNSKNQK